VAKYNRLLRIEASLEHKLGAHLFMGRSAIRAGALHG
jgi:enolase